MLHVLVIDAAGSELELDVGDAAIDRFEPAEPGGPATPARLASQLADFEALATERSPDAVVLNCRGEQALAAALVFTKLGVPTAKRRSAGDRDDALADLLCDLVVDPGQNASAAIAGWVSAYTSAR